MKFTRRLILLFIFLVLNSFAYILIKLRDPGQNAGGFGFAPFHKYLKASVERDSTKKLQESDLDLKPPDISVKAFLESSKSILGLNKINDNDLSKLRLVYNQFLPSPIPNNSCRQHHFKNPPGNLTNSSIMAKAEIARLKGKSFLPKTVFEGHPKVVLFAGLEGTGHHFVMRGFSVVFSDKDYAKPFNAYTGVVGCKTHSVVFSDNQKVKDFKTNLKSFKSKVAFLNTLTGSATQSYPNCNGKDRVLKEPDARELAEICEELGLDFQIILLNRSPESILLSTTVHTHYGPNFAHQTVIYNYVIQILLAQLENLDRRFLSGCVDIELDRSEGIQLLSPLETRLELEETKIQRIFANNYKQKKPVCIHPIEEHTKWNFTKELSDFYRNSIMLSNLCKKIPSFHIIDFDLLE